MGSRVVDDNDGDGETLAPNPGLSPSKTTAFKREERRRRKERKRQERLGQELSAWCSLSAPTPCLRPPPSLSPPADNPWPCDPLSSPDADRAWPAPAPPLPEAEQPPGPQAAALAAARAFFAEQGTDSDFECHGLDDCVADEDEEEETSVEKFFADLFDGDENLRRHYVENWESGRFICLVCEGLLLRKRIVGGKALLQHIATVSRTPHFHAHEAFGNVIHRLRSVTAAKDEDIRK